MEPTAPNKINKYDVIGVIGRGGMGVVYKAIDRTLDRLVAIKMVTSADGAHGDLLKRFYREAQFTANLRHQNIVTVHDLGDFEGRPYLVMEFLAGLSLESMLGSQSTTLPQRISYVRQVCNGLQYAHSRQPSVIHRDIKPANIVVVEDGTAKIVDFGIARLGQSNDTRSGQLMGSYHYMSPEQIDNSELDGRSDIFSLGVVLYQLLTMTHPFEGSGIAQTLHKIMKSPPLPLNKFLKQYPAQLDDIMERALAKTRDERYQSAGEFAFDLLQVEEELKRGLFGGHIERAEFFLSDGEFDRAKQELVQVLDVDHQHTRANELMREVQKAITRQQRKKRARDLRVHAEEALGQNKLSEALVFLEQAVGLDNTDTTLQVFHDHVLEMNSRVQKVNAILERAERAFAAYDLEDAARAADEALGLDPDSARAKAFKTIIEAKLLDRRRLNPVALRKAKSQDHSVAELTPIHGISFPEPSSEADVDGGSSELSLVDPLSGTRPERIVPTENAEPARPNSSRQPLERPPGELGARSISGPGQLREISEWPEDLLRTVERELTLLIGPLAKVVVKKAASKTSNLEEFYNLLAASIARPSDRQDFLARRLKTDSGPRSRSTPATPQVEDSAAGASAASRDELTPAAVERAARLLAPYVGPISIVLAKKASQRTNSLHTLCTLLAQHIEKESERVRFLQDAGFPRS